MSTTDLEQARRDHGVGGDDPWPPEENAKSIADRADESQGELTEEELFPLGTVDGDPAVKVQNIIPKGVPVETTASLRSAEVPSRSGLLDPHAEGTVTVSFTVEKVELVLKREKDTRQIVGAKIRQVCRPVYVEQAR
jgi:hypothetical protein